MPTYDYVCNTCDHAFEEFQSITAKALKKCPACKKPSLRRLIGTGAGIIFKGSGFYETDYRSDSYKKAAKADSGGGSGDSAKSSGESASSGDTAKKSSDTKTTESKSTDSKAASKSTSKADKPVSHAKS